MVARPSVVVTSFLYGPWYPSLPILVPVRTFKQEIVFILARHPSRRIDKIQQRQRANARRMECGRDRKGDGRTRSWKQGKEGKGVSALIDA